MTQPLLTAINDGSIANALPLPLSAEEIDELAKRAETDSGAPFEAETLARIAATKNVDLASFMRLHARLKGVHVKVSELDKALARYDVGGNEGEGNGGQGRVIGFPEIELWTAPVDGAVLLAEIVAQLERHVMLPREATVAVTLWVIRAYCFDAFMISPRLVITSPEKRCGKTTLLRVVQALVPKPLAAANITAAAMFRTIEKHRPTLLIDEADTFLRDNEELRGIINSGHEREGGVIRLVPDGDNYEPRFFSTFCPTAIASIGTVAGTIEDRAIMITMRRRLASETIVRFRPDRPGLLTELARKAARWVADHENALRDADPDMPEALHDRACDNWRGALAIADLVGNDWPQKARAVAQTLSSQGNAQDEQSRGVMLLADIRHVFDDRQKKGGKDADRISSTDLVDALVARIDSPWATWSRGKSITAAAVARLLKSFRIAPNTIKLADGKQPNGYKRSQFDDAFERYLSHSLDTPIQSSPSSPISTKSVVSGQFPSSPQAVSGERPKLAQPIEKYGIGEHGELSNPQLESWDKSVSEDAADDDYGQALDELLEKLMKKSPLIESASAVGDWVDRGAGGDHDDI